MAEIRCPMCGVMNPADAVVCKSCQARLKPLDANAEPPAAPAGDLPDWLSSLRGDSADSGPAEQPDEFTSDEAPDWLSGMRQHSQEESQEQPGGDDWLRLLSQDSTSPQETPQEASDETPDWMKAGQADQPAQTPTGDGEEDWLANLSASAYGTQPTEPAQPEPSTAPAQGQDDTPDWLTGLASWQSPADAQEEPPAQEAETQPAQQSEQAEPEPAQTAAQPPAGDDEKDWLAGLSDWSIPSQDEPQPEAPDAPKAEDTPSWVSQMPAGETPAAEPASGLPDWFSSLGATEDTPAEQPDSGGEQAYSPWNLSSFDATPATPFVDSANGIPPAEPGDETPDWLKSFSAELPSNPEPEPASQPYEPAVDDTTDASNIMPFSGSGLPDWLGEEANEGETPADTGSESHDALEKAQLPGWLQAMRPVESAVTSGNPVSGVHDDRADKSGPLAGLVGTLPGEELVTQVTRPPVYSSKLLVTERQRQSATLIEEMLTGETRPQSARPERSHVPQRVVRLAIALVLIVVLFLPMLSGLHLMPLPNLFPQETVALHTAVQTLPEGSPVLLAVDYEPGLSGELQLAASPIIDHLAARKARLAVISTVPTGPVLAGNLLQISPAAGALPVVNLGFLPGGTAGLQSFAQLPKVSSPFTLDGKDAWSQPALQGVDNLSQFKAVLVLTDNAETARSWIEQVQPSLGATPLFFVVSAQAAPMVQPYLDSGQVQGMVSGMAGGAMYSQITQQPTASQGLWDSYQFGLLVAVILILVGGVVEAFATVIRRPARRRA